MQTNSGTTKIWSPQILTQQDYMGVQYVKEQYYFDNGKMSIFH